MNITNISGKELGYLKGLFIGDGYKYHDKKYRKYYIEFYLNSIKDVDIIKFLKSLLSKLDLNFNMYQDKRFNCARLRITNKEFFSLFDKGNLNIGGSIEERVGFVSGLIDAEGYVNFKKSTISIMNTNIEVLKRVNEFLKYQGIESKISKRIPSKKDKRESYRLNISVKFKSINHISMKAGRNL